VLSFTNNFISNNSKWLGLTDYDKALKQQYDSIESLKTNLTQKYFILGCEHPNVVTLGYRANPDTEIQNKNVTLQNIQFIKTDRGGLATAHEKGQLVIYPICKWKQMGFTTHSYVEFLFSVTKDFFKKLNVPLVDRNCITAIHTSKGKIAFFGLRLKKDISYHGLSINVSNNFHTFEAIRSCGSVKKDFDRLANYNEVLNLEELFYIWINCFKENLYKVHQAARSASDFLET